VTTGRVETVRPILLAATRGKTSVGAAEPDTVGVPEELASGAMALPGPELSSMAGMRCVGTEAGEVGVGPWAVGAGGCEGTLGVTGLELRQALLFESVSEYVSLMARVDSGTQESQRGRVGVL
jgi:hypothetical protein